MAEFDLTHRLVPYLDRHLVFPLLEFLSAKEVSEVVGLSTLLCVETLYLPIFKRCSFV